MAKKLIPNFANLQSIYEDKIDSLIDTLGRTVTLYFEDEITTMPGVASDPIRNSSKFPDFKQQKPTVIKNTEEIIALIQWNPKDLEDYDIRVQDNKNIVRLKTFLTDVPSLQRARYIVPSTASQNIIMQKFKIIKTPFPRGLGRDRYAVSFWQEM